MMHQILIKYSDLITDLYPEVAAKTESHIVGTLSYEVPGLHIIQHAKLSTQT
jgi:hypothetical protein